MYDPIPDFSNYKCQCLYNEYDMCFPSHIPNQTELMDQLTKGNEHLLYNYDPDVKGSDKLNKTEVLGTSNSSVKLSVI